jgi:hypothetical protein
VRRLIGRIRGGHQFAKSRQVGRGSPERVLMINGVVTPWSRNGK